MFVEKGDACLTVVGTRPLFWEALKDPEVELSQKEEISKGGKAPVP